MINKFLSVVRPIQHILLPGIIFLSFQLHAQEVSIDNFMVREDILKNDKLDVIATDAGDKPMTTLNGTFSFSLNGFTEELRFVDGEATSSRMIERSTFVYVKHKNDNGTHAKLYYVIKRDRGLSAVKINWLVMLLIPVSLILLGMMFRKFILIAVILLAALFFFNNSKGLDISTFFETVYNGIMSVF